MPKTARSLLGPVTADPDRGGIIFHATLVRKDFRDPKQCLSDGRLKPRRPMPIALADNFFNSLVCAPDGRWCFSGVLNGWPALTCLELLSITCKVRRVIGASKIKRLWSSSSSSDSHNRKATGGAADRDKDPRGVLPTVSRLQSVRATLRMPSWSAHGWTQSSPGYVFWYCGQGIGLDPRPSVLFGEAMIPRFTAVLRAAAIAGNFGSDPPDSSKSKNQSVAKPPGLNRSVASKMPQAVRVHHFAHRYSKAKESVKDTVTYHAGVLVEWDHGRHVTVIELGWVNGVGGYGGKANWYHDKDSRRPALYHAMPDELKLPWKSDRSEIRVHDLKMTSLPQFQAFLTQYCGTSKGDRFLDPHIVQSAPVRIAFRSKVQIMRYLLNYIRRDTRYYEEGRNCQTFAADMFGFLAGKKDVKPFHRVCQAFYTPRPYLFLYDPSMYPVRLPEGGGK